MNTPKRQRPQRSGVSLKAELDRAARVKAPKPSVPGGVCIRGGRLRGGRPLGPGLWGSGCDAAAWPELWPAEPPGTQWDPSLWSPPPPTAGSDPAGEKPATRKGSTLNRWQAAKKQKKAAEKERARGQEDRDPDGSPAAKKGRWRARPALVALTEKWRCKACPANAYKRPSIDESGGNPAEGREKPRL